MCEVMSDGLFSQEKALFTIARYLTTSLLLL